MAENIVEFFREKQEKERKKKHITIFNIPETVRRIQQGKRRKRMKSSVLDLSMIHFHLA